jgi:hypothetical protein
MHFTRTHVLLVAAKLAAQLEMMQLFLHGLRGPCALGWQMVYMCVNTDVYCLSLCRRSP